MPAARKPPNDLFVALAHPLRRRILRSMVNGGGERSPRGLANELAQSLSKLSYHVTVLVRCGAVELVGTKQVRGSTQHFYRSTVKARWALIALEASAEPGGGRR